MAVPTASLVLTGSPLVVSGLTTDIDLGTSANASASPRNPMLTRARDNAGNEYIYLTGVASTVATDWVVYDELGITIRLVTGTGVAPVAIAMAAVNATTSFGWYQLFGKAQGNTTTIADNAAVFSTATAGRVDDASVADSQVVGATARSTDAANIATFQLSYPWFGTKMS